MDNRTESKREAIINFIYFGILIALYYCFIKFAFGYVFPFLFAAALAMFLQRPINSIKRKLRLKAHGPVSFVLVFLIVTVITVLLVVFLMVVVDELKEFFTFLFSQFSSIKEMLSGLEDVLMKLIVKLPAGIRGTAGEYLTGFFAKLGAEDLQLNMDSLSVPLSGAWSVIKTVPSALLTFLVTVISCFYMTADYENIRDLFLRLFPENRRARLIQTKHTMSRTLGKLFKAYASIMFVTFSEMFLGLYLLKVLGLYSGGYIAVIAFVTCIVDIVPVLGTGTVVIPWAAYNFIFGEFGLGIGLLVVYAVITVIRQIIEPKLVANQAGLPAIVTLVAMFLGAKLFGAFGIILLPFTVILLKMLFDEGIFGRSATPVGASPLDGDGGTGAAGTGSAGELPQGEKQPERTPISKTFSRLFSGKKAAAAASPETDGLTSGTRETPEAEAIPGTEHIAQAAPSNEKEENERIE